jgi:hypothetical protein
VEAIDRALVAGEPAEKIARYRSLSPAAVKRHRSEHLPKALAQAQEARDAARADDLLSEARRLKEVTMALLGRAVQANDLRTALLAVREARGNLELIGKLSCWVSWTAALRSMSCLRLSGSACGPRSWLHWDRIPKRGPPRPRN